jgi:hypothetical protein
MTDCNHCGEPVEGGEWHRSCFLATLGAALVQSTNGGIA